MNFKNVLEREFRNVIRKCQREQITPTEMIVRHRLNVKHISDFRRWADRLVKAGVLFIEDKHPHRILWPAVKGKPVPFACLDFKAIVESLPPSVLSELIDFLIHISMPKLHGLYGTTMYLSTLGPPCVRCLPHGVLLELVQSLFDRRILYRTKNRVDIAHNAKELIKCTPSPSRPPIRQQEAYSFFSPSSRLPASNVIGRAFDATLLSLITSI
jgi:hypothetical protein